MKHPTKILIVEDTIIEANDIQQTLTHLGYTVVAILRSGTEAVQQADALQPDVVIMDIRLKGGIDGIEAAEQIRSRYDIPVVYLTAYADEQTLQRAKLTEPFGYILKPFGERELQTAIEIALYKHRMERQLKESQRWLSTTLVSIGDAVIATDRQGRILFMNPVAETLTRWAPQEAIGQTIGTVFRILSEKDRRPVEIPVERVIRENIVVSLCNHILITRDGNELTIDDSAAPIHDDQGNISGVVLIFHDITERRRTENAIAESERRYRAVSELSSDFAFAFRIGPARELSLEWMTDSFTRITGFTSDEADARGWLNLIHPDDLAFARERLETVIGTAEPGESEFRIIRKDGDVRWLHVRTHPVWDNAENRVTWLYGAARDVTEHKHINAELQEAKKLAEAANQAKSEYLAQISHDLRTPLNSILGYAQLIRRDHALENQYETALESIARSSEHILHLINEVLDLSKIESGQTTVEPHAFQLPGLLQGLSEGVRLRAQHKGISFDTEVAADVPTVVCSDEKRLRQILLNLFSNAVKFTQQGRVTCRVYTLHELDESALPPENGQLQPHKVRFVVEDTGPGIAPEYLEHIFTPFYRVPAQHSKTEGNGLGLAIAQRLLQLLGSKLQVNSRIGQGSRFWFDLDLPAAGEIKDCPEQRIPDDRRICGFTGPPRKILIADEHHESRQVLRTILESVQFQVSEVEHEHDILNRIAAERPDAILLDFWLPEHLKGTHVIEHIRQLPEAQNLIIIGISANAFEHTRQQALTLGCHDFLAKPLVFDELLETLREHLGLEWLYATPPDPPHPASEAALLTAPPDEVVDALSQPARSGDISALRQDIARFRLLHPQAGEFFDQLTKLINEFRIQDIQAFLEQYCQAE